MNAKAEAAKLKSPQEDMFIKKMIVYVNFKTFV